jgi:hypothetical protein
MPVGLASLSTAIVDDKVELGPQHFLLMWTRRGVDAGLVVYGDLSFLWLQDSKISDVSNGQDLGLARNTGILISAFVEPREP